ncbi:MAG: MFS transporter [Neisseriaceae bacterium]|nr:MFS transporter [Neisseriaceae bacterium]
MNTHHPEAPLSASPLKKRYVYEWYVVFICMLAYILSFVDRQIIALMIEPIKQDLQLSDTQFSLLSGLAFSLFYAFMGAPIALLADRYSRSKIMAIGVVFWSLATAACGLSKNFLHLFLARMGVGVGEAALSPAFYSMASDMFPKAKLGRAVAIYSTGAFIGGGVAFLIGGYVISLIKDLDNIVVPLLGSMRPWQATFIMVGLPGVFLALLMVLTIRDPKRQGLKVGAQGQAIKPTFGTTVAFISRHRHTFFYHFIGFSFYAMTLYSLMGWSPAFYIRHFGLSPSQTGYYLGITLLLANTSGVFFSGWLIDWFTKKGHSDAGMRTGYLGAMGLLLPAVLFTQVDSLGLSLGLLAIAMFFASFPLSTSAQSMQILAPNQQRAQVSALFLLVSNLIGLGVGTTVVALITDNVFGSPLLVGHSISLVNLAASLIAIVLLMRGCQHFRRSIQQEQAVP